VQTSRERKAPIRAIQQGANALGELRRVAVIDQNAVPVLANEFRHAVNASGDDWQSERAGLQQHERECLCERTQAEKRCRRVQCANLRMRYILKKEYAIVQTQQRNLLT
jgi:hypothetical protein